MVAPPRLVRAECMGAHLTPQCSLFALPQARWSMGSMPKAVPSHRRARVLLYAEARPGNDCAGGGRLGTKAGLKCVRRALALSLRSRFTLASLMWCAPPAGFAPAARHLILTRVRLVIGPSSSSCSAHSSPCACRGDSSRDGRTPSGLRGLWRDRAGKKQTGQRASCPQVRTHSTHGARSPPFASCPQAYSGTAQQRAPAERGRRSASARRRASGLLLFGRRAAGAGAATSSAPS